MTALAERAAASAWVLGMPGLAAEVARLDEELWAGRETLDADAAAAATPGPVAPIRMAWQAAALGLAQWRFALEHLPGEVARGIEGLRDPAGLATRSTLRVLRDQFAILGAAGAEVGRVVVACEGLLPDVVVDEFRQRPIGAEPIAGAAVDGIAKRELGPAITDVQPPSAVLPVSQLHPITRAGGSAAQLRIRRPGVTAQLMSDTRLLGTLLTALEAVAAPVRALHPVTFVELIARLALESGDLRNEALNLVEIGMLLEDAAGDEAPPLVVVRPVPGLVTNRVMVLESLGGRPLSMGSQGVDPQAALTALASIAVESALTTGLFVADLDPGHVAVLEDGRLALVGVPCTGRFDDELRRGVLRYLMAVFAGDHPGQVDALAGLGALGPTTDRSALEIALSKEEAVQPMTMLMGGETTLLAGMKRGVAILLDHGVTPPLPVALFVRNLFALRRINQLLPEGGSLLNAMMPLMARLPELAATPA